MPRNPIVDQAGGGRAGVLSPSAASPAYDEGENRFFFRRHTRRALREAEKGASEFGDPPAPLAVGTVPPYAEFGLD